MSSPNSTILVTQAGAPDMAPHGLEHHPTFVAHIARVARVLHQHNPTGEDYTWVALLDDDTCLAEIDGLSWGMHIDQPGLAAHVRALAILLTARPEGRALGGVPAGYKAFFTRRRAGTVDSGFGTLCTIIGVVPLPGTAGEPGYLFADHLGQLSFSTDLNAVAI